MLSVTGIFYFYADMINLTTKIILLIVPLLVASILVTDALLVDSRATDSHTVSTDTPVTPVTDEVRVVSFSPEISEIIAYLGGIDSLAATDINSTYPDELKKLPKIADYYSVNQEALSALNFDHILLSRDFNALIISKLTKYQNKLHIYSITDGSDLLKVIEDLGKILHREKQASDIIEEACIGCRVGPRRPSDGRLVYSDHLIQVLKPVDPVVVSGYGPRAIQCLG